LLSPVIGFVYFSTLPLNNPSKDGKSEDSTDMELVEAIVIYGDLMSGRSIEDTINTFTDISCNMRFTSINGFSATMSKTTFKSLENTPGIVISENSEFHITQDILDWGVNEVDAEKVWGDSDGAVDVIPDNVAGQDIKICIADTGIDYTHLDLNDNYVSGYDFVNNDDDPMDDHGHGTHCAGIIGAEDNGIGVIGVAPKVSLYAAKVLNDQGNGMLDDIVAGIDWAVSNDVDIISMSLGGSSGSKALKQACDNAWSAGVIIIAASGNDNGLILYPAKYSSTIAVGAIDQNQERAWFSNYGTELDIVAPGVNINSTKLSGSYGTMSGTSMATAMVSGVCALVLSANPSLSNSEVRDILYIYAVDLGDDEKDYYYGYGLVNAEVAVDEARGESEDIMPPTVEITNIADGSKVDGTVSISVSATDNIGIDKVELYVDNNLKMTDTSIPYTYQWDTTLFSDDNHIIKVIAYDTIGNTNDESYTITVNNTQEGRGPTIKTWTGYIYSGQQSPARYFDVPANTESIELLLEMPYYADFDFSLWDNLNRRTGGWTSSYHSTQKNIPGSQYSGYGAKPEWINVDPVYSSGTWRTSCYSYYGSGSYRITAKIYTASVDITPPSVQITNPSDGATIDQDDVTIYWQGSDNIGIARYEIQRDGGTWTNKGTATSHTFSGLSDGTHTVTVRAYDNAGNSKSDSITFLIVTSGPSNYIFTGSVTSGYDSNQHEFAVPSGTESIDVSLKIPSTMDFDLSLWDNLNSRTGGWTSSDSSTKTLIPGSSYSGYSANPEWIKVGGVSSSGTWKVGCYAYYGSGTYTITVTINGVTPPTDTTPPTIDISNPSNGQTITTSSVTVSWTGYDTGSGIDYYEIQLDNEPTWTNKGTATSHLFSFPDDGSHTVTVRATDNAGNSKTDTVSFTIDTSGGGTSVKKFAVIVGISNYKAISDLSYCDEDAAAWYNHLAGSNMNFDQTYVYGDHTSNYPKYNGIATESAVKAALLNVVNLADNNDIIVFTTSGHGNGNGAGSSYLCMWDCGSGESGEDGNLYDTELANILKNAVANKIFVFIDHCYSGGFGDNLMGMSNKQKVFLTTTCTENGYGYDYSPQQMGAWDYFFLKYSWINHFGGSATRSLEDVFTYAASYYPYSGGDTPQKFDGNPSTAFYLN